MEISRLIEGRASSNVISSTVDAPVREAIALLASKRIGAVPIMEGGRIVGIFSERDVIYRLADEGDACLERPIGEVMTAPAITVERSATVLDALALMTKRRIRHLPRRQSHGRHRLRLRSGESSWRDIRRAPSTIFFRSGSVIVLLSSPFPLCALARSCLHAAIVHDLDCLVHDDLFLPS